MTAAAFRAALDRLGWTQKEAAHRLGVCNPQRMSEWCLGKRPIPTYILAHVNTHLRLARKLLPEVVAFERGD